MSALAGLLADVAYVLDDPAWRRRFNRRAWAVVAAVVMVAAAVVVVSWPTVAPMPAWRSERMREAAPACVSVWLVDRWAPMWVSPVVAAKADGSSSMRPSNECEETA